MNSYQEGSVIHFDVVFRNEITNAAVDPGTVTFSYQLNGGASSTPVAFSGATVPAVGVVAKTPGVVPGDLGEADVSELAPAFRDAIKGLAVDQIRDPIRTEVGLHLVAVCGRRHSGPNLPPREEIEARLEDQQLAQISKRYLRDLRNSATIEVK